MPKLTLELMDEVFAIHSLAVNSKIPDAVFTAPIFFIAKTYDEISIVIPTNHNIESDEVESDWRALEVVGPLGFSLTGLLSKISSVLADNKISIFAISTFDTDYILVKNNKIAAAITALRENDYLII
ncbi:ACT domain-containing protein [Colwelliaceae bacterium 6471]